MVSHDLAEVDDFADILATLAYGRVMAVIDYKTVLRRALPATLSVKRYFAETWDSPALT